MPNTAKTYLITGATSALGLALLNKLLPELADGDSIIAQGCGDLERLAPLFQGGSLRPGSLRPYDVDFTSSQAVGAFIEDIVDSGTAPTHLVHLARLEAPDTGFSLFDDERFALEQRVRLDAAAAISKAFLPVMACNGCGRAVFICSDALLGTPAPGQAGTITLEHAVAGLCKALAAEYTGTGLTVNAIACGKFSAEDASPSEISLSAESVVPVLRFLLSEDSQAINGVILPVNGGKRIG